MNRYLEKTVVVTGACGLIGEALVHSFSAEGAKVIALDINNSFKENPNPNLVEFHNMDLCDSKTVEKFIQDLKGIPITSWINTAYPKSKEWGFDSEKLSYEAFSEDLTNHLGSYYWSSQKILEKMKIQGFGNIINFSSIYGMLGPDFEIYPAGMTMPVAYSAIKAGIINLTRFFASKYGPYGLRVNSISPGGVFNGQNPEFVKNYSRRVPMGRMAQVEEIVGPVLFLASKDASYINGTNLVVDGGWTAC